MLEAVGTLQAVFIIQRNQEWRGKRYSLYREKTVEL
jgi:hypothetical protein